MSHHGDHSVTIGNPGTVQSKGKQLVFLGLAVLGFAVFGISLLTDPTRAWTSFLIGHFYFMGIAVCALFFIATQWITSGAWSSAVRRIAEGMSSYLVLAIGTTVALCFGMKTLYHWFDRVWVASDPIVSGKAGYLSPQFFAISAVVSVGVWVWFRRKLVSLSLGVDQGADSRSTFLKSRVFSTLFIMFFAVSFTNIAILQLKSLDPHWFSTMFGVYIFGGFFQCFFAVLAILTIALRRSGHLAKIVNENHLHDVAKWLFAFTVFWAYTGFSQYMLIWYANLPEETGYFLLRFNPAWELSSFALFIGKFGVPFLALLPRANKRTENLVLCAAFWILGMEYFELMWLVQPEFLEGGPRFGWTEAGVWVGFFGLFAWSISRFLAKNPVAPYKDPWLEHSVFHHHI